MVSKLDLYYILAICIIIGLFAIWIIPQTANFLIIHAVPAWLIIIVICIILPLVAVSLLWFIIQEIQDHFKNFNLSDEDPIIQESSLLQDVFSEEDLQFIEAQMSAQLETHQFEDERILNLSKDLILSYLKNRIKTNAIVPLADISKDLELPIQVIKNLILLLIAENSIDGMLEKDAFVRSD
ncbi:MAG: hypothetical protein ACTSQI_03790 [Candidatus Helarchaeota archaeon]